MSMFKKVLRVVLPVLIVALGVLFAWRLIESKPKAKRSKPQAKAPLIRTKLIQSSSQTVAVQAQGTVQASRTLVVQPQVAGSLRWVSDALIPGGLIKKGTTLVKIDASDYALNVKEQRTGVASASAQLDIEQGQQAIAAKEWELFGKNQGKDASLALRKPQLEAAKVAVEAAEIRLSRAKLNLNRTVIKAPFNAVIQRENAERGQLVSAQSQLATLIGTDTFWVQAAVPLERLTELSVPGYNGTQGSQVDIIQSVGSSSIRRKGQVVGLLGELNGVGRLAQVMIEVDDPLGLNKPELEKAHVERGVAVPQAPLLLGSFVRVEFNVGERQNLIEIPRTSITNGDLVYVVQDGKLVARTIKIEWRRPDSVLISKGVKAGEELVLGKVSQAVDGMAVRTKNSDVKKGGKQ